MPHTSPRLVVAALLAASTITPLASKQASAADVTPPAAVSSVKVNFQPTGAATPAGYKADSGAAFSSSRGYGWIAQSSSTPKSLTGQAFDRNTGSDQRFDTLINMQTRWTQADGSWTGTEDPARWEHMVPNGAYEVLVAVGDAANVDGVHTLSVEGVKAIDGFKPSAQHHHAGAKLRVEVKDGKITLDAKGGQNTKLDFIDITPAGGTEPPPSPKPTVPTPPTTAPRPSVPTPPTTAPKPWVPTPPTTAPKPSVPTPPTTAPKPPVKVTAKGDTNTAEERLLADPNVLWVGTGDENGWTDHWGQTGAGQMSHTSLTAAPAGGSGKAIRIANAGGGTKGDRWGYDGRFGFKEAGIASQDDTYFRYYVWFPGDYEFDTQGKMPGLQGVLPGQSPWLANNSVTCTSGKYKGKACHDERQFGARTMWKNGGMVSYLNVIAVGNELHDDVRTSNGTTYSFTNRYRDSSGKEIKFRAGWNYVEQHVKLNTPGQRNGVFEGWINGVQGLELRNVEYRDRSELKVSQWNLSHFWGGPTTDYPNRATQVYYDDFVVSRAPIGGRS